MNICIFSKSFYPSVGGLEQIALTLAEEFIELDHNVEVVTDTSNASTDDDQLLFSIVRTTGVIERYRAFRRADVILFMNFTYTGVPIAILARKSIVLSHHGIYKYSGSIKTKFIEWTKCQLTRFFHNISVSNFVAKNLPSKSEVIPNAYNIKLFKKIEVKRDKNFVFCGRLVSDKGVDILIRAFYNIKCEFPYASLTIIGDGPEKIKLEMLCFELGFGKIDVEFSGILRGSSLVDKLNQHDCMVIPSLWEEPFGIVALEGIATCTTVISSNRGGLPEAVGECGSLITPTILNLSLSMKAVMFAKLNNCKRLPGEPTIEQRIAHLTCHSPRKVATRYISVCQKALLRFNQT